MAFLLRVMFEDFATHQELYQWNTVGDILSQVVDMRDTLNVQLVVDPTRVTTSDCLASFRWVNSPTYHFVKAKRKI